MRESQVLTDRTARAARPLWRTVFEALENERCLDMQYRSAYTSLAANDAIPNYKVMKQLALRRRFGVLYRPMLVLARLLIPLWALTQWALGIAVATLARRPPEAAMVHVIATVPGNVALIEAALDSDESRRLERRDTDLLSLRRLSAELGPSGVLACVAFHACLILHLLRIEAARRWDLLLHSRDAFVLTMLALHAQRHPTHKYATDDHYQRWSYLLSHHAADLCIVQHGFVDSAIAFTHGFGQVRTLYLRDAMFESQFSAHYTAQETRLFAPPWLLRSHAAAAEAVFLASSFPAVDAEIELVRELKRHGATVIVKFHPAHEYDRRKQTLAAAVDRVCADDEYPACRVFVSHSSFMEFDYRACNIPTFSIARDGGPRATAASILAAIGKSHRAHAATDCQ
jgi:hypothetical protein